MNKQEIIVIIAGDYPVADIRDLIRWLRDEYSYDDLKTSLTKVALVQQLSDVSKEDLIEALDEVLPSWDEEEEEEEEGEPEEK